MFTTAAALDQSAVHCLFVCSVDNERGRHFGGRNDFYKRVCQSVQVETKKYIHVSPSSN